MWLTALSIGAAAVAVLRVSILLEYRRHKPAIGADALALRDWEQWYEIGAAVFAACIGAMCFVVFMLNEDAVSRLVLNTTAFAYTAAAAARNSSRPRVAVTQISLILLPLAIGSAIRDTDYVALSAITLLYYLAAIDIVQFLGANHLRLLLTTQEKGRLAHSLEEQNFRFDAALNNMAQGLCLFDPALRLLIANRRFLGDFPASRQATSYRACPYRMSWRWPRLSIKPRCGRRRPGQLLGEFPGGPVITTLADGRIISISHRPLPDGGLVATFDDVTEQRRTRRAPTSLRPMTI